MEVAARSTLLTLPLSKILEWTGWIVSIGYPLDCYDYLSTCGAKNSSNLILDYSFDQRVQDESTLGHTSQREINFKRAHVTTHLCSSSNTSSKPIIAETSIN